MGKQAFLVDDSKSARIVLGRLLKKNGFDEVEMAESGEQAIEHLKNLSPDAIFVDFQMAGMDGLETITELKKDKRFANTPMVMCTANEGDRYVKAAVEHGALGILAKPPTDESLKAIIQLIETEGQKTAAVSQIEEKPATLVESSVSEGRKTAAVSEVDAKAATPVESGLSEAQIRDLASQAARSTAAGIAQEKADAIAKEVARDTVSEMLEPLVSSLLDRRLAMIKPPKVDIETLGVEPLVSSLLDKRLAAIEPPKMDLEALGVEALVTSLIDERFETLDKRLEKIKPPKLDLEALRGEVVSQVNRNLEEFVRQINRRTVESLIEASIYGKVQELSNDFEQKLKVLKLEILSEVPEKNDMIEHIRMVTEGSLEAHVREVATQISREMANSVATETVEHLFDEHLAEQARNKPQKKPKNYGLLFLWLALMLTWAGIGAAAYFLKLFP